MRKKRAKKLWYRRRKGLLAGRRSKSHPRGPRRPGSQLDVQRGASHLPGLSCGSEVRSPTTLLDHQDRALKSSVLACICVWGKRHL